MDLQSIVEERERFSGWAEFKPGFWVRIFYNPKSSLQDIRRRCERTVYVKHQPTVEVDEDKLRRLIAEQIDDWKGLGSEVVKALFPLKAGVELNGQEIKCDDSNKVYMLKNAYGFDEFVMDKMTDLESLANELIDEELKNSDALSQ